MSRGALLAIAAGGGVAVLVVLLGAAMAIRSCSAATPALSGANDDPAKAHASIAEEGMRAAGTAELRGLGCQPALVVDMAKLLGSGARFREGEPHTMVTCDVPRAVNPPTCERVAAVYFRVIGGSAGDAVGVRVLREGASVPSCSHLYAPNGIDLGPIVGAVPGGP